MCGGQTVVANGCVAPSDSTALICLRLGRRRTLGTDLFNASYIFLNEKVSHKITVENRYLLLHVKAVTGILLINESYRRSY